MEVQIFALLVISGEHHKEGTLLIKIMILKELSEISLI